MAAFKFNLDPTACALSGGEDYELLFTVMQDDYEAMAANPEISVIGYITDEDAGVHIFTKGGSKHPITAQGWEHV
jgi:thiamine-monophosphate kinase